MRLSNLLFLPNHIDGEVVRLSLAVACVLSLCMTVGSALRPSPTTRNLADAFNEYVASTAALALFFIIQAEGTVWDAREWWLTLAAGALVAGFSYFLRTPGSQAPSALAKAATGARYVGLAAFLVAARRYADAKLETGLGGEALAALQAANAWAAGATMLILLALGLTSLRLAATLWAALKRS